MKTDWTPIISSKDAERSGIAEAPDHLIHFHGEPLLDQYLHVTPQS